MKMEMKLKIAMIGFYRIVHFYSRHTLPKERT